MVKIKAAEDADGLIFSPQYVQSSKPTGAYVSHNATNCIFFCYFFLLFFIFFNFHFHSFSYVVKKQIDIYGVLYVGLTM